MIIYKPPTSIASSFKYNKRIFLAGSIEMGKAEDWQKKLTGKIFNYNTTNICVYNPRRDDWDSSWKQEFENPQFYQQVSWELEALEAATHIFMYLQPGTISPISLLELGLYAQSNKLRIVCPDGFHRKGNVEVVANRYAIPIYEDLQDLAISL